MGKKLFFLSIIFSACQLFSASLVLTPRQLCDLELILNGGFAPLNCFLNKQEYESVIHTMRMPDNTVWPMPIMLDVSEKLCHNIEPGSTIELKSQDFITIATMRVEDIWKPNKQVEADLVFGTTSTDHPGVDYLINKTEPYYVGGKIIHKRKFKEHKLHYDFVELRKTPQELKNYFAQNGITKVVAFQTRNPMHRAHYELTRRAAEQHGAHLLLHPVVGLTKPGDIDHFVRVRCYQQILQFYPEDSVTLSLLPLAMRMAGPREALWHAIIRKNYGATHFIIGRDHAGPGPDRHGKNFYGDYDAQELVKQFADEIGITMVPFQAMVYVAQEDKYYPQDQIPANSTVMNLSGTKFRELLKSGADIPSWFSFAPVIQELKHMYPPAPQQGMTIFFTGLSGAGKSTITNALAEKLQEIQYRKVTRLDGDEIRTFLSSELGFSKEHRSLNVRRVGYVAREVTKNGGLALCPLIAPYRADREFNRGMIKAYGPYIEIYVATPLSTCEERDVKHLYALAREGKIAQFTGISDPYEPPVNPELTIDTTNITVQEAVDKIVDYLTSNGYLTN